MELKPTIIEAPCGEKKKKKKRKKTGRRVKKKKEKKKDGGGFTTSMELRFWHLKRSDFQWRHEDTNWLEGKIAPPGKSIHDQRAACSI